MPSSPPRIAIIGAGPAGLSLAKLLTLPSSPRVKVTVYELDAFPTSRTEQGGTLDLHADSGLAAIRKDTTLFYEGASSPPKSKEEQDSVFSRPEIDRKKLKEILLDSVPSDMIKWCFHLREVMADGMLRFDDREHLEGPFDLVVGADGAWSKVRAKLSDVGPVYSGVSGYEMEIKSPSSSCPHVDKMVGKGMYIGLSDGKFMSAQRQGNDSLRVRSWQMLPYGETERALKRDGKQGTKDKILQVYADWDPRMTEVLRQADAETMTQWTLHELPVGTRWDHQQGFTLIGDASSLMTPFSGEGVNKAMRDALDLAACIARSRDGTGELALDGAVSRYEAEMFPRAEQHQIETARNKRMFFGPAGAAGFMVGILGHVTRESSWRLGHAQVLEADSIAAMNYLAAPFNFVAKNFSVPASHLSLPRDSLFSLADVPSLAGKVALVTGGSEGIGLACVKCLIDHDIEKLFVLSHRRGVFEEGLASINEAKRKFIKLWQTLKWASDQGLGTSGRAALYFTP
ncbi:FAD/NAD(P)-binding domain-containing protein [Ceraceosorus guamensis]|uniref:FAD/NAD(P)-binding domain-containing protein n=1 Tax=Ceraceosorus guamensis TaxID=1522189 RepID=A0A316VTJ9_9BASI|nr:FAD/NAD(P)-binding domain-containing protein [Ceraceosorus guamensis]PWN40368.1 FAD/NAD(P)-binding domain-containing protein [Ceraceosorus guamensis]